MQPANVLFLQASGFGVYFMGITSFLEAGFNPQNNLPYGGGE
jgi:hypothetical protein